VGSHPDDLPGWPGRRRQVSGLGDGAERRETSSLYRHRVSEDFETVGWFGFAGMAKKRVAFYVDNLTIRQGEDRNKTTE
jgi:hypothetical protein